MGSLSFVEAIIKKKLLDLHCGYIGTIVSTDGKTATVQPLGLIKDAGSQSAQKQAVVANVPVACGYKITVDTITYADGGGVTHTKTIAVPVPLAKGDLVACLCADRDITAARRGKNELPPTGSHSITDSIIVGIL